MKKSLTQIIRDAANDLEDVKIELMQENNQYRVALLSAKNWLDKCVTLPKPAAEAYKIIEEALK